MLRYLGQGAAITLSILMAFWIDAWWQDRKELEEERETLMAIRESLESAGEYLEWNQRYADAIADSVMALLNATHPERPALSAAEVAHHIANVSFYIGESDDGSSLLDVLVVGGGLADIENPHLRFLLADLSTSFTEVKAYARSDQAFVHDQLLPFLAAELDLTQVFFTMTHLPGHPDELMTHPEVYVDETMDLRPMIHNDSFRDLLAIRLTRLQDIREFGYQNLAVSLEAAITAIDAELGDD